MSGAHSGSLPTNAPVQSADVRATILLVEDDVLIRLALAEDLRASGYNVIEATCADEALSVLYSRGDVDVILTDIEMPGEINGAGLVRVAATRFPEVKLIVASAHRLEPELAGRVAAAFSKPYDSARLIGRIDALLARAT